MGKTTCAVAKKYRWGGQTKTKTVVADDESKPISVEFLARTLNDFLLCCWAVREQGLSATELSKKLGISQPSVSISVKRGEKIAKYEKLELEKIRKL